MEDTHVRPAPVSMSPHTAVFEKTDKGGKIVIAVPLTWMKGLSDRVPNNLRLSISYGFTQPPYCNTIDMAEIATCERDYATAIGPVHIAVDDDVIGAISTGLEYIKYVKPS